MKKNRETLRNYFRKGQFPSEVHFKDLVDSVVNIIDDGFSKTPQHGLGLAPQEDAEQLLSFFRSLNATNPEWQLAFTKEEGAEGLSFDRLQPQAGEAPKAVSQLFLAKDGPVGIHQRLPRFTLDVGGTVASSSRVGTYQIGRVPADKKWHTLIGGLSGIQVFEVIATARGPEGRGRYATTHAIAMGMPGPSRRRIRQNRSYMGFFWNRIELCWEYTYQEEAREGQPKYLYELKARTRTNYGVHENGDTCSIDFHITNLWNDEHLSPHLGPIMEPLSEPDNETTA